MRSDTQPFQLVTDFAPAGDQPQAIEKLVSGLNQGQKNQLLLGVTGSGKTYTMANVIAQTQRPTIIMAHNKTLAAQLYGEFKAFFPNNAVEYFIVWEIQKHICKCCCILFKAIERLEKK